MLSFAYSLNDEHVKKIKNTHIPDLHKTNTTISRTPSVSQISTNHSIAHTDHHLTKKPQSAHTTKPHLLYSFLLTGLVVWYSPPPRLLSARFWSGRRSFHPTKPCTESRQIARVQVKSSSFFNKLSCKVLVVAWICEHISESWSSGTKSIRAIARFSDFTSRRLVVVLKDCVKICICVMFLVD